MGDNCFTEGAHRPRNPEPPMTASTLTVTKNEFNTIFIELDGVLIADSATFRRQRGFNNKATKAFVPAKGFTPRNVAANPALVIEFLAATGLVTTAAVTVAF